MERCQLLSFPSELLENILIFCAADGHPQSIAAIAQTCQELRTLVYDAADHHLWRAMFLTTFDDPRKLASFYNTYASGIVDWRSEFQERIWSSSFIRRHAQPFQILKTRTRRSTTHPQVSLNQPPMPQNPDVRTGVLKALLSAIRTATSLPSQLADKRGDLQTQTLTHAHAQTPMFPSIPQNCEVSLNIVWLKRVLSKGLPFEMINPMFFEHPNNWYSLPTGLALCQLTSYLGVLPTPVVQVEAPTSLPTRPRRNARESPPSSDPATQAEFMSESEQRRRARHHARPYVFSMDYLSPRRNWGPYVRLQQERFSTSDGLMDDDSEEEGDDSDADYVPPDDVTLSPQSATSDLPGTEPTGGIPSPEQLYPDWVWLAAARVIAEHKLRAHMDAAEVAKLAAWDNLREGAWIPQAQMEIDESANASVEGSPSDKSNDERKNYERDWAGVEGVWRRLVCWLDYDDLIYHNSYGDLLEGGLDEAWIIVPMSLQITSYSEPSVAAYPNRPTIHVKGEMGGGGWVGSIDADDEDIRRVHGTVSMLPDGNVRWSITSTAPESVEDEWASEAIQLGGVGSTMGALGMWTGANHEEGDPLGVIWQWRVG